MPARIRQIASGEVHDELSGLRPLHVAHSTADLAAWLARHA